MTATSRTRIAGRVTLAVVCSVFSAAPAAAQSDIVLHAKSASRVMGDWQAVADSTAAGGARMWNPDRGAAKLGAPLANPYDFFELTFNADAGRAYRVWMRGKADANSWANDSVFVQFNAAVHSTGASAYRTGTTDGAVVSLEDCTGCGLSNWGWQDNGYGTLGPVVYFAASGPQTIRVQRREDGVSIDQIVLSATTYVTAPPGLAKNDSTLLSSSTTTTTTTPSTATPSTTTTSAAEIVIPVATAATLRGDWQQVPDSTAAAGVRVQNPDRGAAKVAWAAGSPTDYFDVTFTAEAGRGYRLWVRGQAQNDHWANDSVFVQFSGSLNAARAAAYRIGTTDATVVSIEQGDGQPLGRWGWADNGWATLGPLVYFQTSGPQTLRVQRREDGVSIDQIVLSAVKYLSVAPGAANNDSTLLTGATTTTTPPPPATTETTTTPPPPTTTAPATTSPATTTGAVRLRVMEWNLHHGVGTDGAYNLERIAAWMARVNPDVIFLNEVERFTSWGNEDQPARFKSMLEANTGRRWYSHFSQEFGRWDSPGKGHQILSVYPFEAVGHTMITQSSGLHGAGAASQATIIVNGRTINLIVSHLDPYDMTMRLTQAQDVIRWAAGFAENRILGGDMNAWPDQASIAEINKTYADSWAVAAAKGTATGIAGITPTGATKKGRIDYIFYSKNAPNLVVLDSATPDTRDAYGVMPSDHRPVVSTFEVR